MDILEYNEAKKSIEQYNKLINRIEQLSIIKKNGYIHVFDGHDVHYELFDLLGVNVVPQCDLNKIEEIRILYDGWEDNLLVEFLKPLEDVVPVKYYKIKRVDE
ncbi:hypothetical protein PBV87_11565 [Niameybacter massiliensis]|uniref:Uncharacterized protein n=1 Tax=Holtiella tumoricola TaxID=3018743 RepID=A0AA42J1F9_9FIRM|nr:hypothetical protein [Holtiella tumoricola]MDA3732121.1 hypothetical protein [Holtiella tumoricola]